MPYKQINNDRRFLVFVALTVAIAVVSSISYISILRWEDRAKLIRTAEGQGCDYIGRILGTNDVIVMRCGEEVKLREVKE